MLACTRWDVSLDERLAYIYRKIIQISEGLRVPGRTLKLEQVAEVVYQLVNGESVDGKPSAPCCKCQNSTYRDCRP